MPSLVVYVFLDELDGSASGSEKAIRRSVAQKSGLNRAILRQAWQAFAYHDRV